MAELDNWIEQLKKKVAGMRKLVPGDFYYADFIHLFREAWQIQGKIDDYIERLLAAPPPPPKVIDWPRERGDPMNRGVSGLKGEGATPALVWSIPAPADMRVCYAAPVIGDIDGDGEREVIFLSGKYETGTDIIVSCVAPDGSTKWSYFIEGGPHTHGDGGGVALADLDGDGKLEIVLTLGDDYRILCLGHDGSLKWVNTTYEADLGYTRFWRCSPNIIDVDGDGELEIITGQGPYITNPCYSVGVFRPDGSLKYKYYGGCCIRAPAVGDVDGDGELEMVVGDYGLVPSYLRVLDSQCNLICSTSLGSYGYVRANTVLADLNGDGMPETAAVINEYGCLDVIRADTCEWLGWDCTPYYERDSLYTVGGIAAYDIDGDGIVEIITVDDWPYMYCYEHTGGVEAPRLEWELGWGDSLWGRQLDPVLLDVNGDGYLEIVATMRCWYEAEGLYRRILAVVDRRGNILYQTTLFQNPDYVLWGSQLAVGDVNSDGYAELVFGMGDTLYCYKFT